MYFDLTEDQKALREQLGGLLTDHLPDNRLVAVFDAGEIDRPLWRSLVEMGLVGILVPETHDGLDMGLLTLALVAEALGEAGAAVPVVTNALAAWLIAVAGSERQREQWLGALLEGRSVAAFAFAERGGWQPAEWGLAGRGLAGEKLYVEWGAEADLLIVGLKGGQLALVESSVDGLSRTPIEPVDRSRPVADLRFSGVAAEPLAASADQVEQLRDAMLVMLAADAFGAGDRAVCMAVDYAKVRTQFDRPIGAFQGLKHQLADMTAEMLPCRALAWYAAHAWDAIPGKRSHAAALAKAHVTDVAVASARRAVEAHGGIGYTWEYPLHVFLKRAMFDRSAMGLPRLHRARAAELAGW